jgi:TPR repeat protein
MSKLTRVLGSLTALAILAAGPASAEIASLDARVAEGRALLEAKRWAEAEAKFNAACKAGVGQGCYFEANTIRNSRFSPDVLAQVYALKEKSCTLKYAQGCYSIAIDYRGGSQGLDMDKAKGNGLMDKSCTLGWGSGCWARATDFEYGFNDEPKDEAKAFSYFKKGCDAKQPSAEACKELALFYAEGKSTPKNLDAAVASITKAHELNPEDGEFVQIGRILLQKQAEQAK